MSNNTIYSLSNFIGGLNLLIKEKSPPANSVKDCSNVEFLKSGFIQKAKGYIKFLSAVLNSSNSVIRGIHNFTLADSSEILIAASGDKVYASTDGGITVNEIYSGLDPSKNMEFQNYLQKVIMVNGVNFLEWDGIAPSANVPTYWTDSKIPSLVKSHLNKLWLSGFSTENTLIHYSSTSGFSFEAGTTIDSNGTGTISTKSTSTSVGSGTVTGYTSAQLKDGNGTISGSTTAITGVGTNLNTQLAVGDRIVVGSQSRVVTVVTNATSITINAAFSPSISGASFKVQKTYSQPSDGVGTLSTSGVNVTGVSTLFTTQVVAGDRIIVGSDYREVASVTSATAIVLTSAFPSNLSGQSYKVWRALTGMASAADVGIVLLSGTLTSQAEPGDAIIFGDEERVLIAVGGDTTATLDRAFTKTYANVRAYLKKPSTYAVFGDVDTKFLSEATFAGSVDGYQITVGAETRDITDVSIQRLLSIETPFTTPFTNSAYSIVKPENPKSTIIGVGTSFTTEISPIDDQIQVGDDLRRVIKVVSNTELQVDVPFTTDLSGATFKILKPNPNPGGFLNVNQGDGDPITALQEFTGNLTVFKDKSIYQIEGTTAGILNSPDPFRVVNVSASTGAINQRSVVAIKNDILFVNKSGINSLKTVDRLVQPIITDVVSYKIKDITDSWNKDFLKNCFAIHYQAKTQVWFFVPGKSSSTTNDKVLVYDYEAMNWSIKEGFTGACGIQYNDKPLVGSYDGMIYQHDTGDTYDGAPYQGFFETHWLPITDDETVNKKIVYVDVTYNRLGNWDINLDIGVQYNPIIRSTKINKATQSNVLVWGQGQWGNSVWGGQSVKVAHLTDKVSATGHKFSFRFSTNGANQPFLIQGLDVCAQLLNSYGPTYDKI